MVQNILKLLVIHYKKLITKRGDVVLIYTFPYRKFEEYDYREILRLGDLKLLKCYEFWIPEHEIYDRVNPEISNISDIMFKIVKIHSVCGRIFKIDIVDELSNNNLEEFINNISSKPVGVRVLRDYVCLGFSDNLYVISKSNYRDVDIDFIYGNVLRFIVGSSVKNFYRNLDKLNMYSEAGLLGRKKISLIADFIIPI